MHAFKIASHLLPGWALFVMSLTTGLTNPPVPPLREKPHGGTRGNTNKTPPQPRGPTEPQPCRGFPCIVPELFPRSNSGAGRSLLLCNDLPCPQRGAPRPAAACRAAPPHDPPHDHPHLSPPPPPSITFPGSESPSPAMPRQRLPARTSELRLRPRTERLRRGEAAPPAPSLWRPRKGRGRPRRRHFRSRR